MRPHPIRAILDAITQGVRAMCSNDPFSLHFLATLKGDPAREDVRYAETGHRARMGWHAWVSQEVRRFSRQLARMLVTWGAGLVRLGLPPYRPALAKERSGARLSGR